MATSFLWTDRTIKVDEAARILYFVHVVEIEECTMTESILLAGSTGHLGRALGQALSDAGYRVRALVRREAQRAIVAPWAAETVVAQATDRAQLDGLARNTDIVLSAIGITLQNDGASYDEVDYAANRNLLDAALTDGVGHFAYVASLGSERMRHLPMTAAKEKFVDALRVAPIRGTVLRPNALFHDFEPLLGQAMAGSITLVGDGAARLNPISERDAAARIVSALSEPAEEVPFGGPEQWSWHEIATACLRLVNRTEAIVALDPVKIAATVEMLPQITPEAVHGALTFHLTMMGQDSLGPRCGSDRLADWLAARAEAMGAHMGKEAAA
jgi:uncharacterized protein YbjT (DUF2867 family)